jgi:hypothetical protein
LVVDWHFPQLRIRAHLFIRFDTRRATLTTDVILAAQESLVIGAL